jgi:hypothetical protein
MRKISFLFIILSVALLSKAQVVKYRSFEAAILDSMGELPKAIWLPTNILVTLDTINSRVKIFSKEESDYDIIDKKSSKNGFTGYWSSYIAVDKKGNKCEIKLFSILMPYQNHVATLIVPFEGADFNKFIAYRLRLNEPIKYEERLPLKLTFNSTTIAVWNTKKNEWGNSFPFVGYNTVITLGKDSSILISTQSNSAKYGKGELTTARYKWETKKEQVYKGGAHTNYNLKLTKESEFFIFNIYRNEDGTIKGVAFINDKAMMSYMNTEIGY